MALRRCSGVICQVAKGCAGLADSPTLRMSQSDPPKSTRASKRKRCQLTFCRRVAEEGLTLLALLATLRRSARLVDLLSRRGVLLSRFALGPRDQEPTVSLSRVNEHPRTFAHRPEGDRS